MTQIVLDAATRLKLGGLRQPLELCDEAGTILARLIPVVDDSEYERIVPPLSADELERRRHEQDFGTEEVLRHLESL